MNHKFPAQQIDNAVTKPGAQPFDSPEAAQLFGCNAEDLRLRGDTASEIGFLSIDAATAYTLDLVVSFAFIT
jgi:hypothetical protein